MLWNLFIAALRATMCYGVLWHIGDFKAFVNAYVAGAITRENLVLETCRHQILFLATFRTPMCYGVMWHIDYFKAPAAAWIADAADSSTAS